MGEKKRSKAFLRSSRSILVIVLLVGFTVFTTIVIMSDNSVHGLTVRFNNVSHCSNIANLTYLAQPVIVYSSTSLETTISHVTFAMSVGGTQIGTTSAEDASFGPGQSHVYTLQFTNSTLDPRAQPLNSQVVLAISAQVSAGLLTSRVTSSDTETIHFSSQTC